MLLGARDLGLKTEWRFGFAPFGFRAETTPGVVYLDVGGALKAGVLDHHADVGADSSASLVLAHREAVYNHLLGPWLERFPEGRVPEGTTWRPTIVTHANPDWDGMVAAWLVKQLVEEGDFPAWAPALASYALDVDQGRCRIDPEEPSSVLAPHIGYLALQNLVTDGKRLTSEECLRKGFELLEAAVAGIVGATGAGPRDKGAFEFPAKGAAAWADASGFEKVRTFLEDDRRKFDEDRVHRDGTLTTVRLPGRQGGSPIETWAWVALRPTTSVLNKYWVRAEDVPLFVCPYVGKEHSGALPEGRNAAFPRVVISVDPEWKTKEGHRPDLRGLGYALEKAESAKRAVDGSSSEREGPPRYPDGYCDNKDPWYDGRGHEWTIVDAPACGSCLAYGEVLRTLTETRWWETPLDEADVVLVWVNARAPERAGPASPIGKFEGMSDTLHVYVAETGDSLVGPVAGTGDDHVEVVARTRRFPEGTCPPMTIVTMRARQGATMEGLRSHHERLVASMGGPPDYSYGRIRPARHFGGADRADVLKPFTDGDLRPLEELQAEGEVVLFNGRSLLIHAAPAGGSGSSARADLEVLLYAAFLNETLVALSGEIGRQLGTGHSDPAAVDTAGLLTRMLSFQTRYYQLEVSRLPRGRTLFNRLFEELRLPEHYGEVQAELDRLAAVEANEASERAEKASRFLEVFLFCLAVAGGLQTVVTFFTLPDSARQEPAFWRWIAAVVLASGVALLWAVLTRRRRAPGGNRGRK